MKTFGRKNVTFFETYADYVAARRAERFHVMPEILWTALKGDEFLCNTRVTEGEAV